MRRARRRIVVGLVIAAHLGGLAAADTLLPTSPPLPEPKPHPQKTPVKGMVELGRRLFFEPLVSLSGTESCASCHEPERGFSDELASFAGPLPGPRRTQTLVECASASSFHWDGNYGSIEALVAARTEVYARYVVPPGMRDPFDCPPPPDPVAAKALNASGRYASACDAAFGSADFTTDRIARSIAAYVGTLRATSSPFDRGTLSRPAQEGRRLFEGRAGCTSCHRLAGSRPTFTDDRFHDTGIAWRSARQRDATLFPGRTIANPLCDDPGRARLTKKKEDTRAFKTPSLRDVAKRAPYMHDGSMRTLEEVVRHYAAGCGDDPALDPALRTFSVTDEDVHALVAFLEGLSGDQRPGLATHRWDERARRTTLRVVTRFSDAVPDVRIDLLPAGDVLPGLAADSMLHVVTDASGRASFAPPARTHVRVSLPENWRLLDNDLVPDTCAETTLLVERAPDAR